MLFRSYGGDSNYLESDGTLPVLTVNQAEPTITASANPSTSILTQAVRISTVVKRPKESQGGSPTGAVKFTDNGTDIAGCAPVQLTAGQATCDTSSLPAGAHEAIRVSYSGDTNYKSGETSPLAQQVQDFTPDRSDPSVMVIQGLTNVNEPIPMILHVTAESSSDYTGTLVLSCGGLPKQPIQAPPSCSLSPNSIVMRHGVPQYGSEPPTLTISLAGQSVNNGGLTPPSTPQSPYHVSITATGKDDGYGRLAHSTNVKLEVQQKNPPTCNTDKSQPLLSVTGFQVVTATFACADPQSPEPQSPGATGVAINWGDGAITRVHLDSKSVSHMYTSSDVYNVTVAAMDVVGQTNTVAEPLSQPNPVSVVPGDSGIANVPIMSNVSTTVNFACVSVSGTNSDGNVGHASPQSLGISCQFSSPSLALTAGSVTPMTITVNTTATVTMTTWLQRHIRSIAVVSMLLPAILLLPTHRSRRRRRTEALRIMALLLLIPALLQSVSCGGNGGFTPQPTPVTKTGFYSVLVQGTDSNGVVQTSAIVPVVVGF